MLLQTAFQFTLIAAMTAGAFRPQTISERFRSDAVRSFQV
jgi:hypothetical protein